MNGKDKITKMNNMEIKVGDKVRVREDAPRVYLRRWDKAVEYDVYAVDGDAAAITYGYQEIAIPLKYLVKVEDEAKGPTEEKKSGSITEGTANKLSDMLEAHGNAMETIKDKSYWDAYTADLTKEVALKVANKYDPKEAAEYAVSVAKAVVEGLKRK